MSTNAPYQPVSCHFYDKLLHYATKKESIVIALLQTDEAPIKLEDTIADVFTLKGEEFMLLGSGQRIRLDAIQYLEGKTLQAGGCTILP